MVLLFGPAPVNTHVLQRPLALFHNCQQSEWQCWWNNNKEALFVVGALRERLWQSKGDPAGTGGTQWDWPWEPPRPPALLIDVCRCAWLHDNSLHWGGTPIEGPSINHTRDRANRTFYVYVCSPCVWRPDVELGLHVLYVCECVCAYIAAGWAPCCIIDDPQGGMKVWRVAAEWRRERRRRWKWLETDIIVPGCIE